jgi:hypothetical protein
LTALRREISQLHEWEPKGAQSKLRRILKRLPDRIDGLMRDLAPENQGGIREVLIEACKDQHFFSAQQSEEVERLRSSLDQLSNNLNIVLSISTHLAKRVNWYDKHLWEIILFSEDDTQQHLSAMSRLFRRFSTRDPLDIPIVLAVIVLARLFDCIFPDLQFSAPVGHSKDEPPILNDLRFNSPGVRFAAAALHELDLKHVFGGTELSQKAYRERLQNAVGDAWHNHKEAIRDRGSLIPFPLPGVGGPYNESNETS